MRNIRTIISRIPTKFFEQVRVIIAIEKLEAGIPTFTNFKYFQVGLVEDNRQSSYRHFLGALPKGFHSRRIEEVPILSASKRFLQKVES
jgi:hypothetical protein